MQRLRLRVGPSSTSWNHRLGEPGTRVARSLLGLAFQLGDPALKLGKPLLHLPKGSDEGAARVASRQEAEPRLTLLRPEAEPSVETSEPAPESHARDLHTGGPPRAERRLIAVSWRDPRAGPLDCSGRPAAVGTGLG